MGSELGLSIVVPCFNEEEVLDELHRRVTAVCDGLALPYELILVNDGSRDRTWRRMNELALDDPSLVLVNLSRNHGHQLALTAGLSLCRGERILILDADLQDPPELLPEMLRVMESGVDVVYGRRRRRDGEGTLKLATASLFYRLIERMTDVPIPRDSGDFRLISRRVLEILLAMPERHRFLRGMISWVGFRQEPLYYDRQARFAGTTKYPFRRMVRLAFDAITAFSTKPLILAGWLGAAASLCACGFMFYALASWAAGGAVTGWTSLMIAVAFLGGIQLIVLGILGEYVGRMYEQGQGRPLFLIDQVVRNREGEVAGAWALDDAGPGRAEWCPSETLSPGSEVE